MGNPRLLITGGSGLLGVNWAIETRNEFDVILLLNKKIITLSRTNCIQYNLSTYDNLMLMLLSVKPDILVHTAGLTNIELCENNPILAKKVNVDLPSFLSRACEEINIPFVHISTDHLFEGNHSLYKEDTAVNPLNVYGLTKANAEKVISENCSNALIIRTNFYCWGTNYRQSFSDRILVSLRMGQKVNLFEDVFYSPILAQFLIHSVHELLSKSKAGIFNVVSNERVSKYEFGMKLASAFNLDKSLIIKGKMNEINNLVRRPLDMSLSNEKLKKTLGIELPSMDVQLKRLYEQEKQGISKEISSL